MSSMVMGTNALITKPAQSLAPMIIVYLLNSNGYELFKSGNLPSAEYLKQYMFNIACLLPFVIGLLQLFFWSRYRIRNSHKKSSQHESEIMDIEQLLEM